LNISKAERLTIKILHSLLFDRPML
jgi:hypothetical protein